jgi:hypothetical protein
MDARSDVPKRHMLARHIREVVDILEQKGDQIVELSDLIDRPLPLPNTAAAAVGRARA